MTMTGRASMDEAIDWVVRQRDPGFAEWEAFTAWLEADPGHAEAYGEAALTDDEAGALAPSPERARPAPLAAPRRRWAPWAGGALAAGVAGLVYVSIPQATERYVVETRPGEARTIELEPGTSVALNGGTRITLDREDTRYASLERGQALFDVRHDAARPFRVEAAGATLVDAGTRFDVTRGDGRLDLAVGEGVVIVNPERDGVRVPAGRALSLRDGEAAAALSRVAPAEVGAWREGRLFYDGNPLGEVAADLSRNLGLRISAEPAVAARPFRGAITLQPAMRRDPRGLGPLLGVEVRPVGEGWVLAAPR